MGRTRAETTAWEPGRLMEAYLRHQQTTEAKTLFMRTQPHEPMTDRSDWCVRCEQPVAHRIHGPNAILPMNLRVMTQGQRVTREQDIKLLKDYAQGRLEEHGHRHLPVGAAGRLAALLEKVTDASGQHPTKPFHEMMAGPQHLRHGTQTQIGWIGGSGIFYPWVDEGDPPNEPGNYLPVYVDNEEVKQDDFRKELVSVLNSHNQDGIAETPDFVLAEYLIGCLTAFCLAQETNQAWHQNGEVVVTKE